MDDRSQNEVIKMMISLMGGFFISIFRPVVTHIISKRKTERAGAAKQVNTQWIVDCMMYKKRMNEDDYPILEIDKN